MINMSFFLTKLQISITWKQDIRFFTELTPAVQNFGPILSAPILGKITWVSIMVGSVSGRYWFHILCCWGRIIKTCINALKLEFLKRRETPRFETKLRYYWKLLDGFRKKFKRKPEIGPWSETKLWSKSYILRLKAENPFKENSK